MNYKTVKIKTPADLPPESGTYFCCRLGFQTSMDYTKCVSDMSWLKEVRWYLCPVKNGLTVSRAVYAKLQAENKRLMADIKVMATGECFDAIQLRMKYRKQFRAQKEMDDMIKEVILGMRKKDNNIC